jgi:pentatricopeptide repeat protein
MTLNLGFCSSSSYLSRFSHSPPLLSKLSPKPNYTTTATLLSLLFSFHKTAPFFSTSRTPSLKPLASSLSQSTTAADDDNDNNNSFLSLNEDSLSRVSAAKDANEALQIISVITNKSNGLVSVTDCCGIITAAIDRGNTDLALSVFYAMRSSFDQGSRLVSYLLISIIQFEFVLFKQIKNIYIAGVTEIERWKWSRPDVSVYTSLVQGLAAALKVSDALKMIDYICRVGVSPSEDEVNGDL